MKQCKDLTVRELFPGSDVVRSFGYRVASPRDNYALFGETDCFVCCSPCNRIIGNMAKR